MTTPDQPESDAAVNRRIAELLGWTDLDAHEGVGKKPGGRSFECVPDWCADLNAAWQLAAELRSGFTMELRTDFIWSECELTAKYMSNDNTFRRIKSGRRNHPARAVAEAVLKAMEGKKA